MAILHLRVDISQTYGISTGRGRQQLIMWTPSDSQEASPEDLELLGAGVDGVEWDSLLTQLDLHLPCDDLTLNSSHVLRGQGCVGAKTPEVDNTDVSMETSGTPGRKAHRGSKTLPSPLHSIPASAFLPPSLLPIAPVATKSCPGSDQCGLDPGEARSLELLPSIQEFAPLARQKTDVMSSLVEHLKMAGAGTSGQRRDKGGREGKAAKGVEGLLDPLCSLPSSPIGEPPVLTSATVTSSQAAKKSRGGRSRGRGGRKITSAEGASTADGKDTDSEVASLALATGTHPDRSKSNNKFDPRNCRFRDKDLKLQTTRQRTKKTPVPVTDKDKEYWEKRKKNNMAAKKSRDARRMKQNQIILRMSYLEKENDSLREKLREAEELIENLKCELYSGSKGVAQVDRLKKENARLRHALTYMMEILRSTCFVQDSDGESSAL